LGTKTQLGHVFKMEQDVGHTFNMIKMEEWTDWISDLRQSNRITDDCYNTTQTMGNICLYS